MTRHLSPNTKQMRLTAQIAFENAVAAISMKPEFKNATINDLPDLLEKHKLNGHVVKSIETDNGWYITSQKPGLSPVEWELLDHPTGGKYPLIGSNRNRQVTPGEAAVYILELARLAR